ncbi:hypothetical protein CR513_27537, partial [Mucuna pruriens]
MIRRLLNSYFYPLSFTFHLLALAPLVVHGASVLRLSWSRRCRLETGKPEFKTKSSPTPSRLTVSTFVLSRDCVESSSTETKSDQSLPKASQHSTHLKTTEKRAIKLTSLPGTQVPLEVLPDVQNRDHQKENLWYKATFWRDSTQYFYEGLMMMDRSMIDSASGGALVDKMPVATRHLLSNMASNTH